MVSTDTRCNKREINSSRQLPTTACSLGEMQSMFGGGNQGHADAIFIMGKSDCDEIAALRLHKHRHLLPVIDMTGGFASDSDITLTDSASDDWQRINRIIEDFNDRSQHLSASMRASERDEYRLLSYLYVADRALEPRYAPERPEGISYGAFLPARDPRFLAEKLVRLGYLDRTHFDRLHVCDRCNSTRLNVREECTSCRSPDLVEEPVLHHLGCAYQGPARDFEQEQDLVCPKCSKHLRHYGSDYEKSGAVICCQTCGDASAKPLIGFKCLDCESHYDGQQMATIDYFSYFLNEQGKEFLMKHDACSPPKDRGEGWGLPVEISAQIDPQGSCRREQGKGFILCEISYTREKEIIHEHGPKAFEKTRNLVLENLRNLVRGDDIVALGRNYDFMFLQGITRREFDLKFRYLEQKAVNAVKYDPGIRLKIFDKPEVMSE